MINNFLETLRQLNLIGTCAPCEGDCNDKHFSSYWAYDECERLCKENGIFWLTLTRSHHKLENFRILYSSYILGYFNKFSEIFDISQKIVINNVH